MRFLCKIGWHCGHTIDDKYTDKYHRKFHVETLHWVKYECCRCGNKWWEFDYSVRGRHSGHLGEENEKTNRN
jgi:hypothetical protein